MKLTSSTDWLSRIVLISAVAGLGCLLGCTGNLNESIGPSPSSSSTEQLPMTLNYVFTDEQFTYSEFREKVSVGLNRWIKNKLEDSSQTAWQLDPLAETLSDQIQSHTSFKEISGDRFVPNDAHYLQQRLWTKRISDRIVQPSNDRYFRIWTDPIKSSDLKRKSRGKKADRLAAGLKATQKNLNDQDAEKLASALRLFDWTVRNVHAAETPDWPDDERVEELRVVEMDSEWAPEVGVPGPGYKRHTWQVMMYGRGDGQERARLFFEMCQLQKINAAAIEIKSTAKEGTDPTIKWVIGVHAGDAVYVFEPELGIPVLVHNTSEIATIAQLLNDPGILNSLSLTIDESTDQSRRYWPDDTPIDSIQAYLYAAPESLSKRMLLLEKNLTGNWRLDLAFSPSKQIEQFKSHDSDGKIQLWETPFLVAPFRRAIQSALVFNDQRINEKLRWLYTEEFYIDEFPHLRKAKNLFLKGEFDHDESEEDSDATNMYVELIYSDESINGLGTNEDLQRKLGIRQEQQSAREFRARVQGVQIQMRLIRTDACVLTALCHIENHNPSVALNWLNRVERYDDPTGPELETRWADEVNYHKARLRESLGQLDQAIKLLESDKSSAQKHGNLLRARYLKRILKERETNGS